MKIQHLVFGIVISMFAAGASWAQSGSVVNSFSNTTGSTSTITNSTNSLNFGFNTFTLSNGNMSISQNFSTDTFCQFFSFSFGLRRITQIIQGNTMTQSFGASTDPATDPCF